MGLLLLINSFHPWFYELLKNSISATLILLVFCLQSVSVAT